MGFFFSSSSSFDNFDLLWPKIRPFKGREEGGGGKEGNSHFLAEQLILPKKKKGVLAEEEGRTLKRLSDWTFVWERKGRVYKLKNSLSFFLPS